MPYAQIEEGIRLYYELTGPEDGPTVLQFGGGLFGRAQLRLRQRRLPGAGSACSPSTRAATGPPTTRASEYTIEGWADDGAQLLDALGLDRVLVHGTSMGGMIAIALRRDAPASA